MSARLVTLDKIRAEVARRPAELQRLREQGAKVVGWFNYAVPEEILLALGLVPVRLGRGGSDRLVEHGSRWISTKNCVYLRQLVGLFAEHDDPYVEATDLVAVDATCHQTFRAGEIVEHYFRKPVLYLGVPRNFATPEGLDYFRGELRHFVAALERFAGTGLEEDALARSIALVADIRAAVDELYTWQAADDALIGWKETLDVVQAGWWLDRRRFLELLRELLGELQEKQASDEIRHRDADVRILIAGSLIPPDDRKIVGILEELGARVVGDDIWSGLAPNLPTPVASPTVDAVADAYLLRSPHGALPYLDLATDRRIATLKRLVERFKAHAVVYHTLRYCDAYTFKANETKNVLAAEGVPFLELHTEYAGSDYEAIRTRAEAFIELVRNRILVDA